MLLKSSFRAICSYCNNLVIYVPQQEGEYWTVYKTTILLMRSALPLNIFYSMQRVLQFLSRSHLILPTVLTKMAQQQIIYPPIWEPQVMDIH